MNELRPTKNVKEVQFAGFWGKLKEKEIPETIHHKIFESDSSFHVK